MKRSLGSLKYVEEDSTSTSSASPSKTSSIDGSTDEEYSDWESILSSCPLQLNSYPAHLNEPSSSLEVNVCFKSVSRIDLDSRLKLTADHAVPWQDLLTGEHAGPVGQLRERQRRESVFQKLQDKRRNDLLAYIL
jgi:hypothetical protein